MPRPKDKTVRLKEFFARFPDEHVAKLMDFDDDEWVRLLPFGSLASKDVDHYNDLVAITDPTDEQRREIVDLQHARAMRLVLDWVLHCMDGDGDYASPKTDPEATRKLPPDLFLAVNTTIYKAWNQPEDKIARLGEESGSATPSQDGVDIPELTPSS